VRRGAGTGKGGCGVGGRAGATRGNLVAIPMAAGLVPRTHGRQPFVPHPPSLACFGGMVMASWSRPGWELPPCHLSTLKPGNMARVGATSPTSPTSRQARLLDRDGIVLADVATAEKTRDGHSATDGLRPKARQATFSCRSACHLICDESCMAVVTIAMQCPPWFGKNYSSYL
jgi:hypothetical protein